MKIARFKAGDRVLVGVIHGDGIKVLTDRVKGVNAEVSSLMEQWPAIRTEISSQDSRLDFALAEVTLLAPVARPGKILGIGLNYADHVAESGFEKPPFQLWFSKAVTAINDPYAPIELPLASEQLDYEAELVVVIGKRCRHVPKEKAAEVIFGYCVGNDISVRDWQLRSGQFSLGKSFDTHAPFGPWIVAADDFDPGSLDIRTKVNGQERQSSNTRYFIHSIAEQIEHLSAAMTLEPGDLIFTGTPAGVGAAMQPPSFLRVGDVVRVEIEGIGYIENVVQPERL